MIRKQLCAAALTLTLIFTFLIPASATVTEVPSDVLLSWTGGTDTTATVTWHAGVSAGKGTLLFGTDPSLAGASEISAESAVPASGIPLDYTLWQVAITDLTPNTTYYYAVKNGGARSGILTFTTAEKSNTAFSFMYMGDIHMGVGSADVWGDLLKSAYNRNPNLAFGIFGGDIVDSGINTVQWQDLLDRASPVFSKIPLMPVNGNHDSNFPGGKPELYLDLFDLPQNGPEGFKEEFYSYDYGNCHITALNSWVFSGEQKLTDADYAKLNNWIVEDLASSRAVWKIVVMHHPVYTLASDKVADAVRKNWAPLFEKGGVSLILCGHQHVYSRSYPMTGGQIDYIDGITTIMGNASQKFYSSADETYQAKTVYNVGSYQIVRIDGDTLTVQSYDTDGNELDYFSLKPRKASGTQAVFSDVSNNAWYAPAVNYAAARGLMSGTSDSVFSPDAPVTRAMAAVLLYRLAGSPSAALPTGFSDVASDAWYAPAVSWLSSKAIMSGSGDLFSPDTKITREQLAAILYRYAVFQQLNATASCALSGFPDAATVSPWAQNAMMWAVGQELITGSDGQLKPMDTASRAQVAMILMKFCLAYAR